MKIKELMEAVDRPASEVIEKVLDCVKESMSPRGSQLSAEDVYVEDAHITYAIEYDFPEHKVPAKELNPRLIGVGKVTVTRSDMFNARYGPFAFVFNITLKTALEDADAKKLEAAIKKMV